MRLPSLALVAVAFAFSTSACSSTPEADPGASSSGDPGAPDGGGPSPPGPGVPCGAAAPAKCSDGSACGTDADCTSDYCEGAKCAAPPASASSDGRRNAGETDTDCGGPSGKPCIAGQKCKVAGDCESSCTGGVCDAPSDKDGKKNNGETDTDCGGPNAKKCGIGKACATGPDCGLGYCPAGKCVAPTSSDAVQNGTETDVDCGGAAQSFDGVSVPAAPKCVNAMKCGVDADCASSVCADSKRCVEAPSCRPLHGGYTCGTGELGQAGAVHEDCCKTLSVPGLTMMQDGVEKQVYLDKYEITAGRIRAWVTAIKAQYGGVPNIQAWVKTRMATDPILAAMFPGDKADYLPSQLTGQMKTITGPSGQSGDFDIGLLAQVGPTSYYRGVLGTGGTSGCAMYDTAYGHRTYWFDAAEAAYFGELVRPAAEKDWLDEKSMNCITPLMFTAFCAWDGGYVQSQAAISTAYGPSTWPWGATPDVTDEVAKIANYNPGTGGFGATKNPRYLYPVVNYGTFASDFSPIIAAPGRFPMDASQVLPAADTWMDLGGNMIEWSQVGGTWRGWTGASFEGHRYPRAWTGTINYLDKYGKGGSRCMRLK